MLAALFISVLLVLSVVLVFARTPTQRTTHSEQIAGSALPPLAIIFLHPFHWPRRRSMCSSYSSELLCNASLRLIRSFVCHRRLLRGRPACSLLYECKLPLNCTLRKYKIAIYVILSQKKSHHNGGLVDAFY